MTPPLLFEKEALNSKGVHARPTADIVQAAEHFAINGRISCKGDAVDLKSIMGILTLDINFGDLVTFELNGKNSLECADAIRHLFTYRWFEMDLQDRVLNHIRLVGERDIESVAYVATSYKDLHYMYTLVDTDSSARQISKRLRSWIDRPIRLRERQLVDAFEVPRAVIYNDNQLEEFEKIVLAFLRGIKRKRAS